MKKKVKKLVPELRFSEFKGDWETNRIDSFLVRHVDPVDVQLDIEYKQIGIRSHGKGIFHKDAVTGKALGNKRVFWVHPKAFVVNIVFAWEQAVALTSSDEEGFIASHRFLMFLTKNNRVNLRFVLLFFLRSRGKNLLELASPGGAGRNKTLGQQSFAELKITLPKVEEQEKIASFLDSVALRISQLRRKHELLETYKKGVMQKIFSQQIRFIQDDGKPFPDWKKRKLSDIFVESRIKGSTGDKAKKITVKLWGKGVFYKEGEGSSNTQYYIRKAGQFIYSKLDFLNCAFGVVPNELDGFESTVDLPCFDIKEGYSAFFLLQRIMQRDFYKQLGDKADGSRKAKRIHADSFLGFLIDIPCLKEQNKIVNFSTSIDKKIEAVALQIEKLEEFKKVLLQKMFV